MRHWSRLRAVHDSHRPQIADEYEDIVEVSFRPLSTSVALVESLEQEEHPLALARIDYRVRYSGRRMDAGYAADTIVGGEPTIDSYRLQFWPAPPAPDRILRQTSNKARHAHAWVQRQR